MAAIKEAPERLSLPERIVYQWYRDVADENLLLRAEVQRLRARLEHVTGAVDKTLTARMEQAQREITDLGIVVTRHRIDVRCFKASIDSLNQQNRKLRDRLEKLVRG